jgi:catechol 2,3-dioxygenase-like lactoylglutathione lyase family enzyme
MITGVDHIVLRVRDVERSVVWYAEHLGLAAERLDEWRAGTVPFVSLRVDGTTLVDLLAGEPEGTNVDHVAYVTDRAGFDRFVADHADGIEMGPAQLFGARGVGDGVYVRDPDGHRVEVRTYEEAPA